MAQSPPAVRVTIWCGTAAGCEDVEGQVREALGQMEFRVVVEAQRNTFHAYCPNLKGCHSWGTTVEEAMLYIEDALQFYVDNVEDDPSDSDEMDFGYLAPVN